MSRSLVLMVCAYELNPAEQLLPYMSLLKQHQMSQSTSLWTFSSRLCRSHFAVSHLLARSEFPVHSNMRRQPYYGLSALRIGWIHQAIPVPRRLFRVATLAIHRVVDTNRMSESSVVSAALFADLMHQCGGISEKRLHGDLYPLEKGTCVSPSADNPIGRGITYVCCRLTR